MEVRVLTEETLSYFENYVPEDIAENIGRLYYRGYLTVEGPEETGGIVWKETPASAPSGPACHIVWFRAQEEEAGRLLLSVCRDSIRHNSVKKIKVSLPAKTSHREKELLEAAGFEMALMEADEAVAPISDFLEIGFMKKNRTFDTIRPLRSATHSEYVQAIKRMTRHGYFGRCEDLNYLPKAFFENNVSCFCEENGGINGLLLCHKKPSGRMEIELLAAVGADYQKLILGMINQALKSAAALYPPETEIIIDRHNLATLALGEKLVPGRLGMPIYLGERTEAGRNTEEE